MMVITGGIVSSIVLVALPLGDGEPEKGRAFHGL